MKKETMKNLVLIGYRGTGKTEVSKVLSQKLGIKRVGIDKGIIKKTGMSISSFVKERGWGAFRETEKRSIREFSKLNNVIIDTGGGSILDEENVKNLRKGGILFLLKAEINTIKNRIKESKDRPPLTNSKSAMEEIEKILKQREKKYNKAANHSQIF